VTAGQERLGADHGESHEVVAAVAHQLGVTGVIRSEDALVGGHEEPPILRIDSQPVDVTVQSGPRLLGLAGVVVTRAVGAGGEEDRSGNRCTGGGRATGTRSAEWVREGRGHA
jgi:hypothetical protein